MCGLKVCGAEEVQFLSCELCQYSRVCIVAGSLERLACCLQQLSRFLQLKVRGILSRDMLVNVVVLRQNYLADFSWF
jgi:hypothetical protein